MAKRRSRQKKNKTTKTEWKKLILTLILLAVLFVVKYLLVIKNIQLLTILFIDPLEYIIAIVFLALFTFILEEFFGVKIFKR